jgi:hypothetical protein
LQLEGFNAVAERLDELNRDRKSSGSSGPPCGTPVSPPSDFMTSGTPTPH